MGRLYVFRDRPDWFVKLIASDANYIDEDQEVDNFVAKVYTSAIHELKLREYQLRKFGNK